MLITDITEDQNNAALWAKSLEKRDRSICSKELDRITMEDRERNPWDTLVAIRNNWDKIRSNYVKTVKGKRDL